MKRNYNINLKNDSKKNNFSIINFVENILLDKLNLNI